MSDPRVVAFQGRRTGRSAFALINRRWSETLEAAGYRVLDYPTSGEPDFVIHHDFESRFTDFVRPSSARTRCIAVRTWDFGPLPSAWVTKINAEFDRYWAHTAWIAEQASTAGVDPARIAVVPNGIDPEVFHPGGLRRDLPTEKTFRFLFVGGVSLRKGSDLLLEAYARAFTRQDDVCLVLKDHSADLFYREDHARRKIADLVSRPDAPELLHLDVYLPDQELAALYRSCDVAVFPYRAEGFCIPIVEAMACGTPAIVPDFGACRDYCTPETSWMAPVHRIRAPVNRSFTVALGFEEHVSEVDFCEVPVDTLVEFLQTVRGEAVAVRQGKAAEGLAVARRMTWDHIGRVVLGELDRLG